MHGVLMTAGSLAIARAVSAAVQIAIVPLLLNYLGVEVFGFWVTVCSLVIFAQVADLGLSNGMVNEVARLSQVSAKNGLHVFLVTRYRILFLISISTAVFGFFVSNYINWRQVLSVPQAISDDSLKASLFGVFLAVAIQVTVNANQQVWLGMQKGVYNGISMGVGAFLNLGAIVSCIKLGASLHWLVISSVIGSIIAQTISTFCMLAAVGLRLPNICRTSFKFREGRNILRENRGFLMMQVCGLLSYNLDIFLISHFIGGSGVAEYSIVMRLFSMPTLVLSLLLSGLWPVVARAQAAGDFLWINKNFSRTLGLSLLLSITAAFLLYLKNDYLISVWTKSSVMPSQNLLVGFAIWVVLTAIGGNLATYMNGIGEISYQAKLSIISAFFNVMASLVLIQLIGVGGPIWGSVITTSVFHAFVFYKIREVMRSKIEVHASRTDAPLR
jgi:O-antigen/teichoic acid export membrane protein